VAPRRVDFLSILINYPSNHAVSIVVIAGEIVETVHRSRG
jgi:hypothetical protein